MKDYIHQFAKSRGLTLTGLANALDYASPTSLFRLMHANVRKKSIQDFLQRMTCCLTLTDQERDALYFAVDSKLEGETYARQNRSVRHFMSVASLETPPLLLLQQDGTPPEAAFFAADPARWRFTLVNACSPSVIQFFAPLVEQGAQMDHYFLHPLDMDLAKAAMPVLFHHHYRPWRLSNINPVNGLSAADLAIFTNGETSGYMIFTDSTHAVCFAGVFPWTPDQRLYQPTRKLTAPARFLSDYPDFCRYCASLEEDNDIYLLKPDVHYSCIPGDIFRRALLCGPLKDDPTVPAILDTLTDIFNDRHKHFFSRRQHVWLVMKYGAMLEFIQTGCLCDHFVGFSPFTPEERRTILANCLRQMQHNPYIHFFFLKNDDSVPDLELDLYEVHGLLLQNPHTTYNLSDGVAEEILIDSPVIMRQWRDYFMNTIIRERCLTAQESVGRMETLLELCPK